MPRARGIKQLIAPSAGLITEQSKLAPVEGSTIDEDNFTYNDDGSIRRRRLGIGVEESSSFFTLADAVNTTNATSYALWESVAGDGSLNLHVFQIGATLHFIKDAAGNLESQKQTFTYDLDLSVTAAYSTVETEAVRSAVEATQGFVGTGGVFNFSAEDHNGLDIEAFEMMTVKDGKFTKLQ